MSLSFRLARARRSPPPARRMRSSGLPRRDPKPPGPRATPPPEVVEAASRYLDREAAGFRAAIAAERARRAGEQHYLAARPEGGEGSHIPGNPPGGGRLPRARAAGTLGMQLACPRCGMQGRISEVDLVAGTAVVECPSCGELRSLSVRDGSAVPGR